MEWNRTGACICAAYFTEDRSMVDGVTYQINESKKNHRLRQSIWFNNMKKKKYMSF